MSRPQGVWKMSSILRLVSLLSVVVTSVVLLVYMSKPAAARGWSSDESRDTSFYCIHIK